MRVVQSELAYLNKLVRELMTGSAAGFAALAIVLALITSLQIGSMYLGLSNYFVAGKPSQHISSLLVASAAQFTPNEEPANPSTGEVSTAIVQASSVAGAPGNVVPVIPPVESDIVDEPDKKQVNDGLNKAGNANSSFKANANSYDKKNK